MTDLEIVQMAAQRVADNLRHEAFEASLLLLPETHARLNKMASIFYTFADHVLAISQGTLPQ